VGIVFLQNNRVLLAGLKDRPVTRGMKNTPPLAAVENIGQWTKVWTKVLRRWKIDKIVKAMVAVKSVRRLK